MDSFAFYISVLRKNFTQYCSDRLAEMNVTYGQLFILIFVGKKGTCSPKEISISLGLDPGHLNRTISKLEEHGLLLQKKNEQDRRAKILTLTDKGRQVFEMSHDLFYQWDEIVLEALSDAERLELLRLLKKTASHR